MVPVGGFQPPGCARAPCPPPQLSAGSSRDDSSLSRFQVFFFLPSLGLRGELSRFRAPWKSPSLVLTCAPASLVAGLEPRWSDPGVGAPAATCCPPMHCLPPSPLTTLHLAVGPNDFPRDSFCALLCPGVSAYSRHSIRSPWLQWPPSRPFLRGRCCSRAGLLIRGLGSQEGVVGEIRTPRPSLGCRRSWG